MGSRYLLRPVLVAAALGLAGVQAQAQAAGPGSSPTAGQVAPVTQGGSGTRNLPAQARLSHGDRKFIQHAAGSGMFEVEAAQLAAGKATDPNVKSLAGMLVDQHTAANNELTRLANAKGVELPAAPPHGKRKEVEKLGRKSGDDFDRSFVRDVGIKAHEQDIRMFEGESKHAKDADLKAFVDKTLPVLRQHLAAARKLPQSGKNGSAMGANRR
jgi:putative membrane protein